MTIKPSPIGRHCLVCLEDLSEASGCYVYTGGKCAPHDVLTCLEHGSNGRNGFSEEEYRDLLERAVETLSSRDMASAADDDPVTAWLRELAATFNRELGRDWNGGDVVQYLTGEMPARGIDPDRPVTWGSGF